MTADQEADMFENIGAIKEGIKNLNTLLDNHTAQDMTQFTAMSDTVKVIDGKVDRVISDLAIAAAVKVEQEKNIKKIAGVRAVWVSSAIGLIYTLMQIFVPMLWHK